MNAHLYQIVGLSMLDAEDRYGSGGAYVGAALPPTPLLTKSHRRGVAIIA